MADDTFAGPVDFVVFAFPDGAPVGPGLRAVLERVDAGLIEILDLECVGRDASGAAVPIALADLNDSDLSAFEGAYSGILEAEDLAEIAGALEPGSFAIAIVYEDRALAQAATVWARAGGIELLSGGVDIDDLARIVEEGTDR